MFVGWMSHEAYVAGLLVSAPTDTIAPTFKMPATSALMTPHTQSSETPATILAFGDMMLDRSIRLAIYANGPAHPFEKVEPLLTGNDIVVANAEGPFTRNKSVTAGVHNGPLTFTFDPATLPTLKQLGFTVFSQANNHSLNFGSAGLRQSERSIEAAGMQWFGDPSNIDGHDFATTTHGQTIAFVGYNQFDAEDDATLAADQARIESAIRAEKQTGAFVIVYPHWGVEYAARATAGQTAAAHAFIDAGADLILGSHPHVIEPLEIYKGKLIFYSLGNFIFDQYQTGPTAQGLAVRISLASTSVSYQLVPLDIYHGQASVMDNMHRSALLNTLADESNLPYPQGWEVRGGEVVVDR